jgi:hypothetical protein
VLYPSVSRPEHDDVDLRWGTGERFCVFTGKGGQLRSLGLLEEGAVELESMEDTGRQESGDCRCVFTGEGGGVECERSELESAEDEEVPRTKLGWSWKEASCLSLREEEDKHDALDDGWVIVGAESELRSWRGRGVRRGEEGQGEGRVGLKTKCDRWSLEVLPLGRFWSSSRALAILRCPPLLPLASASSPDASDSSTSTSSFSSQRAEAHPGVRHACPQPDLSVDRREFIITSRSESRPRSGRRRYRTSGPRPSTFSSACCPTTPRPRPALFRPSSFMEQFALVVSQQSLHLALQMYWILVASMQDYQPEDDEGKQNKTADLVLYIRCAKLQVSLEKSVVFGSPNCTTLEKQYTAGTLSKDKLQAETLKDRLAAADKFVQEEQTSVMGQEGDLWFSKWANGSAKWARRRSKSATGWSSATRAPSWCAPSRSPTRRLPSARTTPTRTALTSRSKAATGCGS